jgi:single-strand DNA-binding protein
VFWRNLAEIVEKYVRKGSQVFIEGRLRSRSWEDQNGQKRFATEIVADTMRILGRRNEGQEPRTAAAAASEIVEATDESDDLPF